MKYLYSVFCLFGATASLFSLGDDRTVALSALLAPIQLQETKVETEAAPQETAEAVPQLRLESIGLQAVLSRLEEQVGAQLDREAKLSLSSKTNWRAYKVSEADDWELQLDGTFSPDASGRWYPLVNLRVNGETVSTQRLSVRASLFQKVWMINQNLNRGDVLHDSALTTVVRDIYAERVPPIAADEVLNDYELERSLARGRVLTWDDLKMQPQVRRNSIVDVTVDKGALSIRMRARAMEDGLLGDVVKLRNLNTNREFFAAVRGKNVVEFEL